MALAVEKSNRQIEAEIEAKKAQTVSQTPIDVRATGYSDAPMEGHTLTASQTAEWEHQKIDPAPAMQTPSAAPMREPLFPQANYPEQARVAMASMNENTFPQTGSNTEIQNGSSVGQSIISEEELKLLNAIAAIQIRYGKPEEAIAWLALVRKHYPNDYQSARLYAVALLKLNRFEQAEHAIYELERIETDGGLSLLYRSLLDFKNNQIASARMWFQNFLGHRKTPAMSDNQPYRN